MLRDRLKSSDNVMVPHGVFSFYCYCSFKVEGFPRMSGFVDVLRRPSTSRTRLVGIFIIALVAIAYQVLLTRIFSVILFYHFTFAGISLAMLGITVGAEKVYLKSQRFAPERFEEEWAKAALGFAVSSALLTLWFLYAPLFLPADLPLATLICSMFLFIIPFTYSGICVTLTLTQSSPAGKVYAADLVGAALGCIAIVALLYVLDPVTIVFLLGALCAYAAWFTARTSSTKLARICKIILCVMLVAAAVQGTLYLSEREHLGVFWAKGVKQQHTLFERWNTFSRVRVVDLASMKPFGWGFGHYQTQNIEQKRLDIDADAGSVITRFDGDLKPLSFLADDVINAGYTLRPVHSIVVIGVGGGRDVMSALYFGVKKIFAVELNPAVIEALRRKFADFTGHFTELPQVSLVNAEARSWIAQYRPPVDLIQISLTDTWAATAAGGLALTENRLYTLEAWKEFLGTLRPGGMLEVSRWYDPTIYKGEFYRLLSLATESLKGRGVPLTEIRRHIFTFNAGPIVTVVVSPTAFTPAETAHAYKTAKEKGFNILVAPDFAIDEISRTIASGKATTAFYDGLPFNVAASTDDHPFFFFTARLTNPWDTRITLFDVVNNSAVSCMAVLLLGTLLLTATFILQPLAKVMGRVPLKEILSDLSYFAGIGLGFMLIEISQMQRLMVFLGHPVFGLSVVLFTLLLFGGIGSVTVHSDYRLGIFWKAPFFLCLVLCAVGVCTPFMTEQFTVCRTSVRIVLSIAMLAPAGFFMGMMLPVGMIISARHREFQPWFWGINGAASVFASILGMAISMQYGIAATYWTGVGAYVCCLLIAATPHRAARALVAHPSLAHRVPPLARSRTRP
jgi:hypothetical protein